MSNKTEKITLIENKKLKKIIENIPNKTNILMENDFMYIDEDSETEGESSNRSNIKYYNKSNEFNENNKIIIKNIDENINKNSAINEINKIQIKINRLEFKGDENSSEKQKNICAISNNSNNNKNVNKNKNPLNIEENTKSYEENKINNSFNNKIKAIPKDNNSAVNDIDEDDPYNELQAYLEKIKSEINDVFEEKNKTRSQQLSINSNKPKDLKTNDVNSTKNIEKNLKLIKNENLLNNSTNDHINELRKRVGDIDELKSNSNSNSNSTDITDVNTWANKLIKELDNLVGTSNYETSHPKKYNTVNIVKPAKHTTIPLQSFKLNIPNNLINKNFNKHSNNSENKLIDTSTILKIEEETNDDNNNSSEIQLTDSIQQLKRKKLNQTPSSDQLKLINKKNSISSTWKSDESILKNIQQTDEDTKSTSSSICDETSAILSSGKSGNSLDFELDDQNESGIGTATPPKDITDYNFTNNTLKNNNNNKIKNSKLMQNNSISTSDQDDSLDILSLYDCNTIDDSNDIYNDDDCFDSNTQNGSDDCIKCSRESIKINDSINDNKKLFDIDSVDGVILRKKSDLKSTGVHENQRHAISFNNFRSLKTRSHIIEPTKKLITSLASASNRDLIKYDDVSSKESIGTINSVSSIVLDNDKKKSTNIHELPSLSSASLHSSGNDNMNGLMIELSTKSNSAPILMKKIKKLYEADNQNILRYSRSQSDRYLAEIEAIEACKWLRAAGFPQYAQMYEDLQFPIDLSNVAKDHPILENDPLQSLYRRLAILNRCASMRLDSSYKHPQGPQKDDSDDESFALSENWTFQPQSRRWSRVGEDLQLPPGKLLQKDKDDSSSKESSPERFDDDNNIKQYTGILHNFSSKSDTEQIRMRRTGSERLKDGAKAFLRRVESIKSRRRKRQNRDGFIGSNSGGRGPVLDLALNGKNKSNRIIDKSKANINIVFSTPPSPSAVSPIHFYPRNLLNQHNNNELKISSGSDNYLHPNRLSPKHIPTTPRSSQSQHTSPLHFFNINAKPHLRDNKSDESSYFSDSQDSNAGSDSHKLTLDFKTKKANRARRFLQTRSKVDDIATHSDSECQAGRPFVMKDPDGKEPVKTKKLSRGGSLNLGKESKKYRDAFQNRSFRGKGSFNKKTPKDSEESSKPRKTPVVRWHSFQNHDKPENIFKKCCIKSPDDSKSDEDGIQFVAMSCGQLQVIRKLALVTLTGCMERYCPTHRSGWNWELPKFIKKIKTPDYKDRRVFGVPLLLIVQRTSQSLPIGIIAALRWLKINALEQTGLFRKSGVKSRIAKLKELTENTQTYEDYMDLYDSQQAYDVADMLKQYFRELPDALLTAKMSETFVAIFQHLPPEIRIEAIQAAILLLPDENRDVLLSLLTFLNEVSSKAEENQMTASNLAVCLAPSLFHSNIATGNPIALSPRRTRKAAGQPNMKELAETKASHECLELMISHYKQIFTASPERILKCNFGYMEESKPVPLEALGEGMPFHNWRGYLYECTSATIKEGKEKTRGWIAMNSFDSNIEIAYKKVGDGHPLRLWRTQTEVDASANQILQLILNERSKWDSNLLKSQMVKKLDEHTEIFQYVFSGQIPTDFCVLRSWQVNLPKEACVIVETSIDHRDAKAMQGSVRGIVLASRYLIEPSGNGKCRIMNLSRVDLKGRTPEWYNKNYGHICSQYLTKIRSNLKNNQNILENK